MFKLLNCSHWPTPDESAPLDVLAGRCLDLLTGIVLHFLTAPSTEPQGHRMPQGHDGCWKGHEHWGPARSRASTQHCQPFNEVKPATQGKLLIQKAQCIELKGKKLARNKMKWWSLRLSIIKFRPIPVESAAILERWLPCKHHGHCRRQPRWWTCRWEASHGLLTCGWHEGALSTIFQLYRVLRESGLSQPHVRDGVEALVDVEDILWSWVELLLSSAVSQVNMAGKSSRSLSHQKKLWEISMGFPTENVQVWPSEIARGEILGWPGALLRGPWQHRCCPHHPPHRLWYQSPSPEWASLVPYASNTLAVQVV